MAAMIVGYKYSKEECQPGERVAAEEDHLPNLNVEKQKAELAVRRGDPRGSLRARCVYAFADRSVAEDLLGETEGQHLYEMEIVEGDVLHCGDLRIYDEIVDALRSRADVDDLVSQFWQEIRRPNPRIEICCRKMKVRRKLIASELT